MLNGGTLATLGRDQRGSTFVQSLILVCVLALGAAGAIKNLSGQIGHQADCAAQHIANLGLGAEGCSAGALAPAEPTAETSTSIRLLAGETALPASTPEPVAVPAAFGPLGGGSLPAVILPPPEPDPGPDVGDPPPEPDPGPDVVIPPPLLPNPGPDVVDPPLPPQDIPPDLQGQSGASTNPGFPGSINFFLEEAERERRLLARLGGNQARLLALVSQAGGADDLEELLGTFSPEELEQIFPQLDNTTQLDTLVENVGADTSKRIVEPLLNNPSQRQQEQINNFLGRLNAGVGNELSETRPLDGDSIIVDSQVLIALGKSAQGQPLSPGERDLIAFVNAQRQNVPGTNLRVTNVTVGEAGSGIDNVGGVPLVSAGTRETPAYEATLNELRQLGVGGQKGDKDRAIVADALFAQTEPGVTPTFAVGDKKVFGNLANKAASDALGKPLNRVNQVERQSVLDQPGGFDVTIGGRTIHVIPLKSPRT